MNKYGNYFSWSKIEIKELIPTNFSGFLNIFSSLRNRNFSLYFAGQCLSLCGTWIQYVAMSWLIYRLTDSIILLATVTFVNQIPNLIITPFAGVLSDRFNKFRIIATTQVLFMLQALTLAALVLTGVVEVWHIMALSLFNGIVASVEAPARQSFYTKLVPKSNITNAIALNSVTINGSRFIGPTIGGILIGLVGEGWCFLINGVSYIAVLGALMAMRLKPFNPKPTKMDVLRELREGVNYIRCLLPIRAVLFFVAAISFFGLPLMAILPALVRDTLGGDSTLLGYLTSSIGAGALTAALYLASRREVKGLGKVVTITGFMMGIGLVLLSFTHTPAIACLVAFPTGFAMIGSMAASNTLLQTIVDDDKRGRVMSFFTMSFAGMAPLGGLVYGWVAEATSLATMLLIAGVVCLGTAAIYEYYRPVVRAAAHNHLARRNSVVPQIASAIGDPVKNPF